MTTHGKSGTRTWKIWTGMLNRCQNPNGPAYEYYGGRGIKVCERWHDFENFLGDMGEAPPGLSIDRKDNNGNYCKENCRWATKLEQAGNMRSNRLVTYKGETRTIREWSRHLGVNYDSFYIRFYRNWPTEKIFETPFRKHS